MPKRSHEETKIWCRTKPTGDQHGIMYNAAGQTENGDYICEGSRMVGNFNGKSVWVVGGYTDVMNTQGIEMILDEDVERLSDHETTAIFKFCSIPDPYLYDGYSDEESIWFYLKPQPKRIRREKTPGRTPGRTPRITPGRTPRITPGRTPRKNGGKRKSRKNRK